MMYPSAAHSIAGNCSAIINVSDSTTLKLQAASYGTSGNLIKATVDYNGSDSNECTYLRAIKVGVSETDTISSSESLVYFLPEGGTSYINITSNTSFYVYTKPSWLTVTPTTAGNMSRLTLTVDAYVGLREGILSIRTVYLDEEIIINLEQGELIP